LNLREDKEMEKSAQSPIRVMRIIARMNVGGPAVQVTGLMRGINSCDFDHRLYTGFCATNEADYLDSDAEDIKVNRVAGLGRRVNFRSDVRAFVYLVKEIRDFKPHVIHTHTAKAGVLGRVASIVSFHPSIRVHTFHGHLLNGYFGPAKKQLIVLVEKLLALITDELLAVGTKVREDLLRVGIGNIGKFGLMPPGLKLRDLPQRITAQESLEIDSTSLQCAFIGRVTQIKRPDRFLAIVSELKKRGVELEFFMAGDGELLDECRAKIQIENLPVKVLGWQSNIENVLSAADMILLTSDNEGTPLCLIQGGMAGLPVVSTNVGSVSEIVLHQETGLITGFDVHEIADALAELVNNKEMRSRLGSAAQKFTLANFGVARLVQDHEKLYKKLLPNPTKF
jgi:glycosyltransferase involved in cell wall biosynthesis